MIRDAQPEVLLITDFRGLIPQRIHNWDGYDVRVLEEVLWAGGAKTRTLGVHALSSSDYRAGPQLGALYASSQAPLYKQHLQAVIANLHFAGVRLYPSFEHMLAHDDKVFQAVRLQRTDIEAPRSWVFGDKEHALSFLERAEYPLVGKSPAGYGSAGVSLIRDKTQGLAFVTRSLKHRVLQKDRPLVVRAWQRLFPPAPVLGSMLFQQFIPDLEGDWKVLIWGDLACGVYRLNRPNDFRASGSGRLEFKSVPEPVLEFARGAMRALGLPWGSFDIAFDGSKCLLLEYQAVHFGLTALDKGRSYHVRGPDGTWDERPGRIRAEAEMAKLILADLMGTAPPATAPVHAGVV
jgi:glutathione synthase/RimK-type ligase-like ATP-grasp enzyme